MSYTNGVGGFQPVLGSIAPAATKTNSAAESANAQNQRNAAVGKTEQTNHGDQTNLSSAGGIIAHALSGSDTRSEKIAALQQAIASGSYKVSSSDVAGKMIQSLLE